VWTAFAIRTSPTTFRFDSAARPSTLEDSNFTLNGRPQAPNQSYPTSTSISPYNPLSGSLFTIPPLMTLLSIVWQPCQGLFIVPTKGLLPSDHGPLSRTNMKRSFRSLPSKNFPSILPVNADPLERFAQLSSGDTSSLDFPLFPHLPSPIQASGLARDRSCRICWPRGKYGGVLAQVSPTPGFPSFRLSLSRRMSWRVYSPRLAGDFTPGCP